MRTWRITYFDNTVKYVEGTEQFPAEDAGIIWEKVWRMEKV